MASLRERTASDGTTTYQVLYRDGGRQASKTLADAKSAQDLIDRMSVLGVQRALTEYGTTPGTYTLDDLLDPFLAWTAGRIRTTGSRTADDYRRDYDNWIAPALGWRPADSIDERIVQQWVDDMRDGTLSKRNGEPLAPKTIACRHALLHSMFKWASAPTRKHVPHNPCVGTELPPRVKTPPRGLHPGEWQALHAALSTINKDAADLAEFLVASGWRWSEAVALSTHDVEDYGSHVFVTMTQVARRDSKGQVEIVAGAKSDAGLRRIRMDAYASAMVRRRVADAESGGLVFTNANGYAWNYSHFLNRVWNSAVEAANLSRRPTPHALRHTAVGYLAMTGKVSLAEIQRRIGHSNISTTIDVYGGLIEDVSDDALDAFAALRDTKPKDAPALKEVHAITE